LGCVEVESGTTAEVVALIFAGDVETPRAGVRVDYGDAVAGCGALEEAFFGPVVTRAG